LRLEGLAGFSPCPAGVFFSDHWSSSVIRFFCLSGLCHHLFRPIPRRRPRFNVQRE